MILWHLGIAAALTYVTLGRRRIDYRFVLVGAILPDALDGLIGLFVDLNPSGRGPAHSLLAVIFVAVAIIVGFSGERRLSVFGLAVGWLTHLVADGMWAAPETFLWPAFGMDFTLVPTEPYSVDLLSHPWDHLATWGGELVGVAALTWFWVAFRLGEGNRLRLFLRDGYLRP
ncbi:MAG: metal-dependent hydrolase [Actinomycetota bacterium]